MAKIIGNTTTTPMAIPDWNQTDEKKADYIKNKPDINQIVIDNTTYTNSEPLLKDVGGILANNHGDGFNEVPLRELITELLYPYVEPEIKSFTLVPTSGTYEKPKEFTVTKATVNMTKKSKDIKSVRFYQSSNIDKTITNNIQTTMSQTFSHLYNNPSQITYTVEVSDGVKTVSKDAIYTFYNCVYYGVATEPTTYNSAFVLGLEEKVLRGSRVPSFNVTAGANQYIYYCLPKGYGACTFTVGGFTGGFSLVDTISFTNSSGYTEDYYIYRSDKANLGSTTVNVK